MYEKFPADYSETKRINLIFHCPNNVYASYAYLKIIIGIVIILREWRNKNLVRYDRFSFFNILAVRIFSSRGKGPSTGTPLLL